MTRRKAMSTLAAASALLTVRGGPAGARAEAPAAPVPRKGNLRHSVSRWCYNKYPLAELCRICKDLGIESIELLGEKEWAEVKQHGLTCALCNGPSGIGDGWNNPARHDDLVKASERLLPVIAAAGLPNMIVFSGNRREGQTDAEGADACAQGLARIMPTAEKLGVNVIMELLNSKRNHKGYQCDRTAWGAAVCKKVGSPRMKLLYDIYHMQIMEGDVIDTLKEFLPFIGHIHTGGVPGRNEIDERQELNYRRICQALVQMGYKGFVGQEFVPRDPDPIASLRKAIEICDV